jgi:hypothetical protein
MTINTADSGENVPDINLPETLQLDQRPSASRDEVASWFAKPAPFRMDPDAFWPLLAEWLARIDQSTTVERGPIVELLSRSAKTGTPFTYNAVGREEHGGRRYAYRLLGHHGCPVLTRHGYKNLPHPRALLQSIPNAVRPAIRTLPGHDLVLADIQGCFPAIAAALTGDARLQRDLRADMHQRIGDMYATRFDAARRRQVGKLINNALVGGATAYGLREALDEDGIQVPLERACRVHDQWWLRYGGFKAFLDDVRTLIRRQVDAGKGLTIRAPDGHCFRFSAAELSGKVGGKGKNLEADREAAERRVISSLFRAIEGSALDRALAILQPLKAETGLRLVLTMYDGLVMAVPEALAEEGAEVVRACMVQGLRETGVDAGVDIKVQPRWGVLP